MNWSAAAVLTTDEFAQKGKIPAQKVGRHQRFHKEAIGWWLEQSPGESETETTGDQ